MVALSKKGRGSSSRHRSERGAGSPIGKIDVVSSSASVSMSVLSAKLVGMERADDGPLPRPVVGAPFGELV